MNTDRKRGNYSRKSKRVILVSYEGKNKTEKIYFNNFCNRENDFIIQIVPGNETDPVNLVKQTIQKKNEIGLDLDADDRAFCIFDTDTKIQKEKQIIEAINLASKHNIKIVTSCPCFEVWLLLHYEYTTGYIDNESVISKLRKHNDKYEKNYNIYPEIKTYVNTAIANAKKLEKYQLENDREKNSVEANPHTNVYEIIEDINKDNVV
ncbi:MAG: RloB domain-containing protein [Bacilli bacterium]|nr:RloB domain-containing protein [Bacilli bacterium]MBQ8534745.1 RloB domain-containing protein [Bacilli bacterium]